MEREQPVRRVPASRDEFGARPAWGARTVAPGSPAILFVGCAIEMAGAAERRMCR